jgi:hypothetical protein
MGSAYPNRRTGIHHPSTGSKTNHWERGYPVTTPRACRILNDGGGPVLVVEIVAWMLAPSAVAYGVLHIPVGIRFARRAVHRWHPPPRRAQGPPIERLAADLRRISADLDALVAAGRIPGRILRVRATTAAYDDTLLLACRALDVPPAASRSPMSSEERLQTEAMLAGAGLVW